MGAVGGQVLNTIVLTNCENTALCGAYLLVPNDIGKVHRIAVAVEVNLVQCRVLVGLDLLLVGATTWLLPRCNGGKEGHFFGFCRCNARRTGMRHPHKGKGDALQQLESKTRSCMLPTPCGFLENAMMPR